MRVLQGIAVLLVAGLISLGCGSEADDGLTTTEQKRLTIDPRAGQYLVDGQHAYERGAYRLALAYTDSAEQFAPDLADIHYLRGAIYTQLNRLDIAEAAYQTVLELDPEYPGAHFSMGLNAFRRGLLRDAINQFQAEGALEETSNLMLELGRAYARMGEPDSAQMAYERAIALDSTNTTAYMWLGQHYEEMGDLEKALEISRIGHERRPEDLDYQYILGSLLNRLGRPEEAVGYLRPVAEELPWHQGAQFNLAQALQRLGQEEEAQTYFTRADSAQQFQQQVNEAQDAINREPENLDHWIKLGNLQREVGRLELAVEAYKNAVTLAPGNMHLQNNLALLIMESGDTPGAIRRLRAIISLDSTLADVWLNLGVAYANAGQADAARQAWQTVLRLEPNHPAVRSYLTQLDQMADAP